MSTAAEDLQWAVDDQIKQMVAAGMEDGAARQRLTADITRLSRFYLLDAERTGTKLRIYGRDLLDSVFWSQRLYHEDVIVGGIEAVTDADVERACVLYVSRLAEVEDAAAQMFVRADFPDRVAAMRAVLEQFANKSTQSSGLADGDRE